MGVVGSGRELLTVEAQFVAELGLLACVEVREGMDFSVDSPEEATKGLWNGYSWQGQQLFCSSVVCSWCTSDLRSSTLDFKEGSVTRAGSGFSGSFVGGFPTARLGFTLRRGHKGTEHLSTKGTGLPLLEVVLFVIRSCVTVPPKVP